MNYEVLTPITKDTANVLQPGEIISESSFSKAKINAYLAAGAIEETKAEPKKAEAEEKSTDKKAASKKSKK